MANDDSYQAFKCPSCGQFISNQVNSCRFCFISLTDEMRGQALEKELEEGRQYRFKSNKTILYTGTGIFAIGVLLTLGSLITLLKGEGFYIIWSPIIALFGLGQIVMGLLGMLEERKRKRKSK